MSSQGHRSPLDMLLSAAVGHIHRYVVLTDEQADAAALWAAHSHVVEAFSITPYLNPHSATKQSGKTRLLEVLRPLTARPVDTDGMTPAALIRTIDVDQPTLLLDEADAAFNGSKDLAEALRGILNSGFRSRGNFIKCVGEGANMTTRKFSTYGAKAIAGIDRLPDTIADRSIPIRLRRRAPGEKVAEFFEEEWEEAAQSIAAGFSDALRPELEFLADARPARPDGISDRAKDAWKALLAIADLAGGEWPDRARKAAQALCGDRELDEQEIGVRLIGALRLAFEERDVDKLSTHELLEALHGQEGEPWSDWSRGNPISARKVADLLRPFEIKPKRMRVGEENVRGYLLAECEDAFERYLPRNPGSKWNTRNNGSSKPETALSEVEQNDPCSTSENPEKPHEQADVPLVPLPDASTGENGEEPTEDELHALGIEPLAQEPGGP